MNKRLILIIVLALLFAIPLAYSFLWFSIRGDVQETLSQMIADAEKEGAVFKGEFTPVTGFPGPFEASFSGILHYQDYALHIPQATIESFFIPGHPLSLTLPKGAAIEGAGKPEINNIDGLSVTVIVPQTVPAEFSYNHAKAWKETGGTIDITSYDIRKESLSITGAGQIVLNDALQPEGKFTARMTGGIEFIKWLKDHDIIENKDAMISGTIIGGLSKEDPETGEKAVHTVLTLQNRMLFLGPLRLLLFPVIDWPRPHQPEALAEPPALLQ